MATVTVKSRRPQQDCFQQLFGSLSCTGKCIYKWDPVGMQYVLQPGSSCSGGAGCKSCSPTLPATVLGLAFLLGPRCFPDPFNINFSCGVNTAVIAGKAARAIKLHRLLVGLVIGLGLVSIMSIAGLCYILFFR
jgi:hypothetical protein